MKKEYADKLYNDFPLLYADRNKSLKESLMGFGFECGDGWFDLIYDLSTKLERCIEIYIQENPKDHPRAVQVKEKFGGLRFYMTSETSEMSNLINEAENKSYETCEICGKEGKPNEKGWVTTLCDDCKENK